MLIRRPPAEVFAAFVNPMVLRKFWLADACGPLAPGARVHWKFMVPGAEIHLCARNGARQTATLEALLPRSFGPEFL